jgi:S-formylglutathione hydrolase FrmB
VRVTFGVTSSALGRTLPCTLLLPPGRRPEAVLYLLHGGHSHHAEWATRMDLLGMVARWPLAVALPEGDSSLWIHGHDGRNWERYAAFDVPAAVESHLGLSLGRERRAVAGLSMGGLGALHLGLSYPERYGAVASLSGAFGMTWWNMGRCEGSPFLPALGPPGSGTRAWVDPWRTLERALARVAPEGLPPLWFATGSEDDEEVTEAHRALHASLERARVRHVHAERPGGHDWAFWERETEPLLAFVAGALALARTTSGRPDPR